MGESILYRNKANFKSEFLSKKSFSDSPGVLTCSDSGMFGGKSIQVRTSFLFEDNIRMLYEDTLAKIGRTKADALWYRCGKDVAFRYFLRHRNVSTLKIPKSMIIRELEHFSSFFIGMHLFDRIKIELEDDVFEFYLNKTYSQKPFVFSYLSGVVSGFLSYLINKNIETRFFYEGKDACSRIVANDLFEKIHIPDRRMMREIYSHSPYFRRHRNVSSGLHTFSDFLCFKVITMCDKEGFMLKGKVLFPFESGIQNIFFRNYDASGLAELFRTSLVRSSEHVCSAILNDCATKKEKIKAMRNIISALGLGEVYFRQDGGYVVVSLLSRVFVHTKTSYLQLFINGFLNFLHEKELSIIFEGQDMFRYRFG